MRILYVATQDDPLDPSAGSGADFEFYHAFLRHGADVQLIGPFADKPALVERVYRRAHRIFSRRRYAKHSIAFLHQISNAVGEAISTQSPDIVFSVSAVWLASCPDSVPLVFRLDTSLKGQNEQYPIFSALENLRMMRWEKKSLRKASLIITYSEWNAAILRSFYNVPSSNILITPVPASLPEQAVPRNLTIQPREMKPLRLLWVGRDDRRKGVDIAIQIADLLNENGVPAELHIVGLEGEDTSHVRYMGLFRKNIDSQLRAYVQEYEWAHFLLHPARFEAGGVAVSEAAAFGLPALTNAAGGLATTVKQQVSGIVLPRASPASAYVAAIQPFLDSPAAYQALRGSTRERYDSELTWDIAGDRIFQALREIVEVRRRKHAPVPAGA